MIEVVKYVHEHIKEKMTIDDISTRFGYTKWHFCYLFKRFTKVSFVEYVRHYKMQMAAMDILKNQKVITVAMEYGYDTVSGFEKAFLNEFGCFPREFKNNNKLSYMQYMLRRDTMNKLSDRCAILRDEAVNKKKFKRIHCVYSRGPIHSRYCKL